MRVCHTYTRTMREGTFPFSFFVCASKYIFTLSPTPLNSTTELKPTFHHASQYALQNIHYIIYTISHRCAPTRTALMTGRYPYNTGLMEYGKVISEERSAVPLSFQMLPKLLTQHAPTPYKACRDISRMMLQ